MNMMVGDGITTTAMAVLHNKILLRGRNGPLLSRARWHMLAMV